jgi:transcriptional regulator with XRE-family HTH domain
MERLADRIGVSTAQARKYEVGDNRIAAGRLWQIARELDVEVADFFAGLETAPQVGAPIDRPFLDLARHWRAIRTERHRDALGLFARILVDAQGGERP